MINFALEDWLDIATRDLCQDARERVSQEVRAHYAGAYDLLIASGETAEVATGGAMASLGSAKKARRRYARSYMTKADRKLIGELTERGTAIAAAICVSLQLFGLTRAMVNGTYAIVSAAIVLAALLVTTIAYIVRVRFRFSKDVPRSLKRLVVGTVFLSLQLPFVAGLYGYFLVIRQYDQVMTSSVMWIVCTLAVVFYAFVFLSCRRLLRIAAKLTTSDTPSFRNSG